jgi:hypothetical protein
MVDLVLAVGLLRQRHPVDRDWLEEPVKLQDHRVGEASPDVSEYIA